jgi:hypothetical protein
MELHRPNRVEGRSATRIFRVDRSLSGRHSDQRAQHCALVGAGCDQSRDHPEIAHVFRVEIQTMFEGRRGDQRIRDEQPVAEEE